MDGCSVIPTELLSREAGRPALPGLPFLFSGDPTRIRTHSARRKARRRSVVMKTRGGKARRKPVTDGALPIIFRLAPCRRPDVALSRIQFLRSRPTKIIHSPRVTSDLVPTKKLSNHGRGHKAFDVQRLSAPKSFVSRILISKFFEKCILRGFSWLTHSFQYTPRGVGGEGQIRIEGACVSTVRAKWHGPANFISAGIPLPGGVCH
jgi:hypothetical protein